MDIIIITLKIKGVDTMVVDYTLIGRRIKYARMRNKITQEEMAAKLDVSVAFYSRVERGTSHVNLARIIEISDILGMSVAFFITGVSEEANNYLDVEFKELLEKCTPKQQKFIYQIAELVLENLKF